MKLKGLRGVIVMNHKEKAVDYYNNNFNCSQGVFTAFATEMGMDEKLALKIATNFGGGERKGELCGAVAGALMVLGLRCGHCDSEDAEGKASLSKMVVWCVVNCWDMTLLRRKICLLFKNKNYLEHFVPEW